MRINYPQCPICRQDIISDATIINYCALCGMSIEDMERMFCCSICEDKFKQAFEDMV